MVGPVALAPVLVDHRSPVTGEPLGVLVERVVVPGGVPASSERRLEGGGDPLLESPVALASAVWWRGDNGGAPARDRFAPARGRSRAPPGGGCRRMAVTEVGLRARTLRPGDPVHQPQVALPGPLQVPGFRPSPQRLRIVGPGPMPLSPLLRDPPGVAERFLDLHPERAGGGLEQGRELSLRLLTPALGIHPPAGIRQPEGHPAFLWSRGRVALRVEGMSPRVGLLRVEPLCLLLDGRVVPGCAVGRTDQESHRQKRHPSELGQRHGDLLAFPPPRVETLHGGGRFPEHPPHSPNTP